MLAVQRDQAMDCPHCQSQQVVKNGRKPRPNGTLMQRYRCRDCSKQFNERTGTLMARLLARLAIKRPKQQARS